MLDYILPVEHICITIKHIYFTVIHCKIIILHYKHIIVHYMHNILHCRGKKILPPSQDKWLVFLFGVSNYKWPISIFSKKSSLLLYSPPTLFSLLSSTFLSLILYSLHFNLFKYHSLNLVPKRSRSLIWDGRSTSFRNYKRKQLCILG